MRVHDKSHSSKVYIDLFSEISLSFGAALMRNVTRVTKKGTRIPWLSLRRTISLLRGEDEYRR